MQEFDLIVIGTGAGAGSAAYPCREAGWKVAVVDYRPFGGTCELRGCDPKKVLVGGAELVDWSQRMQGKAVSSPPLQLNWSELMAFKRTFTAPAPANNEKSLHQAGIVTFHQQAHFVGPTTLQVGTETLQGRYIVLAPGAKPAHLDISGEEYLTTSEQFLELEQLPPRIIFVGGGYIAFEFAHISLRAGAQVQIIHRGARPLSGFDPDLVAQLVTATRELGATVLLDTSVKSIEKQSDGQLLVRVASPRGDIAQTFTADMVVHAAGRVPEIEGLDLEKAGVKSEAKQGITVNEYLQSVSNPAVYAAGDAAASGGLPLTPVAGLEGGIVARNLLEGNQHKPNYAGVPTVVFTIPPLARVGLQEKEAREQGLRFKVNQADTSEWYSSRRINLKPSGYKVLVEEAASEAKTGGRILGAHLLGYHSEEIINLFGLAIRYGLSATDLKEMVYAYPTSASDIGYMV
jgi:glutathione reductase (NADPH)